MGKATNAAKPSPSPSPSLALGLGLGLALVLAGGAMADAVTVDNGDSVYLQTSTLFANTPSTTVVWQTTTVTATATSSKDETTTVMETVTSTQVESSTTTITTVTMATPVVAAAQQLAPEPAPSKPFAWWPILLAALAALALAGFFLFLCLRKKKWNTQGAFNNYGHRDDFRGGYSNGRTMVMNDMGERALYTRSHSRQSSYHDDPYDSDGGSVRSYRSGRSYDSRRSRAPPKRYSSHGSRYGGSRHGSISGDRRARNGMSEYGFD